jgi:hypothetical protein
LRVLWGDVASPTFDDRAEWKPILKIPPFAEWPSNLAAVRARELGYA